MKIYIKYLFFVGLRLCCKNEDIADYEYIATDKMGDGLYIERFYKSSGVYGGGIQKYFLTDSINEKMYLGCSNDKEYINFSIDEGRLKAEKFSRRGIKNNEPFLKSTRFYPIP